MMMSVITSFGLLFPFSLTFMDGMNEKKLVRLPKKSSLPYLHAVFGEKRTFPMPSSLVK